jgi:hypothetical protein
MKVQSIQLCFIIIILFFGMHPGDQFDSLYCYKQMGTVEDRAPPGPFTLDLISTAAYTTLILLSTYHPHLNLKIKKIND